MQNYFSYISQFCLSLCQKEEYLSGYFSAEEMDFARFNHNKIRQAGNVVQLYLNLNLATDDRQASITLGLSQEKEVLQKAISAALKKLRDTLEKSNKDPYIFLNLEKNNSFVEMPDALPKKEEIIKSVLCESTGLDLVGYYVGGPIYRGFFNSSGQTNWFKKSSFLLDTSIYYQGDQAVKQNYADTVFDEKILRNKIKESRLGLDLFKLGKSQVTPGNYNVYFSPEAVYEILSLLNFQGFSKKSLATKSSPLLPLLESRKTFNPKISFCENSEIALGPNFQSQGFLKPKSVPIIRHGKLINSLISPKTAKEYGLDHNGVDASESMTAMDMAPGNLFKKDILSSLDNGLFINNLWYLNYSDKLNGCITGMTRFLCYTVKNGQPNKAFGVMRFDESIYKIFGENLLHLTKERDLIVENSTYDERATACAVLPGIIVKDVRFTL